MACVLSTLKKDKKYLTIKKDVYLYNEKYYYKELNKDSWFVDSWPGKDITEKNNKNKKEKGKYIIDPLAYKDKLMALPLGTEIYIGEHAFTLKFNNKEYIAYVVSALTGKDRLDKKSWKYGLIYLKFQDMCQIGELIKGVAEQVKGEGNFKVSPSGKIPAKPVLCKTAYISSGYYRTDYKTANKTAYDFHGAIDIPTNKQAGQEALAMFEVKFLEARPKDDEDMGLGGYQAIMQIRDAGPYNDLYKDKFLVYMHLAQKPIIPEGSVIKAGEKVGIVGNTGKEEVKDPITKKVVKKDCGYVIHLHVEIRPNSKDDPKKPSGRLNLNEFFKEQGWYDTLPEGGYIRDNEYLDALRSKVTYLKKK